MPSPLAGHDRGPPAGGPQRPVQVGTQSGAWSLCAAHSPAQVGTQSAAPCAQRLNEHDADDSHHILKMLDFLYYKVRLYYGCAILTMAVPCLLWLCYTYYGCTMLTMAVPYLLWLYYTYCGCTMLTMAVPCLLWLYYTYYGLLARWGWRERCRSTCSWRAATHRSTLLDSGCTCASLTETASMSTLGMAVVSIAVVLLCQPSVWP